MTDFVILLSWYETQILGLQSHLHWSRPLSATNVVTVRGYVHAILSICSIGLPPDGSRNSNIFIFIYEISLITDLKASDIFFFYFETSKLNTFHANGCRLFSSAQNKSAFILTAQIDFAFILIGTVWCFGGLYRLDLFKNIILLIFHHKIWHPLKKEFYQYFDECY